MANDDLIWKLGQRTSGTGSDYRIFKTAFVDGTHPRVSGVKRFSLLECGDWVNVIPLTKDDRCILVRQFRVGTAQVCLEIPGGMVDPGEAPEVAAARELVEETGYTSRRWRKLGTVAPNPAFQNNYLHSYLALDCEPTSAAHFDSSEVIDVELAPLIDVQQMLRDGTIDHALVVAAFGHLAFEMMTLRRP